MPLPVVISVLMASGPTLASVAPSLLNSFPSARVTTHKASFDVAYAPNNFCGFLGRFNVSIDSAWAFSAEPYDTLIIAPRDWAKLSFSACIRM